MIFQFPSGLKDCTVTVIGKPSSTFKVDGGSSISFDSNGQATVVVKPGSHTFTDGYINTNVKTVNISGDTTVALGVWFGSAGTKTLPAGTYSKIVGSISGYVNQKYSNSGQTGTNVWPACGTNASASCSGVASKSLYSGTIAELAYRGTWYDGTRSDTGSADINVSISTTGGGDLTISVSSSSWQDSGNVHCYVSSYGASLSNMYVY